MDLKILVSERVLRNVEGRVIEETVGIASAVETDELSSVGLSL